MSTMVMLSRRTLLLSALLCGILCSSSAFTVRSGADISQILSPERQQQKCQSFSNRSSLDISKAGRGVALSVASGGAAASSDDGPSRIDKIRAFTSKNFFLLGMMVAVALARAFPHVSRLFLSNTSRYHMALISHTNKLTHYYLHFQPQTNIWHNVTARQKWRNFASGIVHRKVWCYVHLSAVGSFAGIIRVVAINS